MIKKQNSLSCEKYDSFCKEKDNLYKSQRKRVISFISSKIEKNESENDSLNRTWRNVKYEDYLISFQDFFVWALLLIVNE